VPFPVWPLREEVTEKQGDLNKDYRENGLLYGMMYERPFLMYLLL
jgi:hypothetical protein